MSLDKVQLKPGAISIGATITSGGFPGGVDFCFGSGFSAGLVSATDGGGALYMKPMPMDATAQTLVNGSTIVHNGAGCVMLTAASAVTSIVMQAGVREGQHIVLVNTSGTNSITFNTTQSVSLVASSVEAIAVNRATLMTWNSVANRWFRVNV